MKEDTQLGKIDLVQRQGSRIFGIVGESDGEVRGTNRRISVYDRRYEIIVRLKPVPGVPGGVEGVAKVMYSKLIPPVKVCRPAK